MSTLPVIGSDGWTGAAEFNDEAVERATKCDQSTKWMNVVALCSSLRDGMSCKIGEKFSVGTQNLVKLVEFEDGTKWIARIPMRQEDDRRATDPETSLRSEIATYKFLKQNTSVPIPEIYAASATNDNSVGVPYILMEYIHGTVANGFEYDGMGGPGNPEQHAHLLKQMAQIMVQLASIRFDKIGSIFQNDETEEFYIGPELETGKGPFSTAQEYYNAVSSHRLDCYIKTCFETNLKVDEDRGVTLPLVFNHLMPFFTNSDTDTGPFYLTNADFGFHNVLIDADFNIQGVIDCDDCLSAPLHVAAQLPSLSGLDPHPPGMETKKPLAIKFGKVTALDIERFVKMVAEAELSLQGENLKTSLADTMQSDGFYMWQGLDWYNSHCGWVNTERLQSFWYMYFRRIKGPSAVATFSDCPIPGYTDSDFADDDDDGDEGLPDEKKDKQLPVEATQSMDSTEPEKNEPADSTKVTPASEPQVVGVGAAEANGPSIDATQKDKEITKALDFLEGKI